MIISLAVGFFLILPIMIVILPVVLAYASVEEMLKRNKKPTEVNFNENNKWGNPSSFKYESWKDMGNKNG